MNTGTQQRDRVASMAAADPEAALALAVKIADPWFRCQALSIAAVHVPDRRRREGAIDQAFASANDLDEPNRVVTVSSWPIKALALTGNAARVSAPSAGPTRCTICSVPRAVRRQMQPSGSRGRWVRPACNRSRPGSETRKGSRFSTCVCPVSHNSIAGSPSNCWTGCRRREPNDVREASRR